MTYLLLPAGLGCLGIIAGTLILYPFRRKIAKALWVMPLLTAFLIAAYAQWGSWPAWMKYQTVLAQREKARAIMANMKSPDELINRLRQRLDNTPASAKGWYLLGRLYAGEGKWQQASEAFATSMRLKPEDEATAVNYAQSLWQLNQQQFNDEIRSIIKKILQANQKQPDALAMLAMDAYDRKDFSEAVEYWRRLLIQLPPDSKEAKSISKAIAKAQESLP
ncbi:tetratricopeptide repeat protein [Legionella dresdenensis]|uniref:Tetratricopeptide repeat protein n=1 Tax=Legionella dresdenensis TaxID=450200 RepID=A0ABV8CCQ1_9GAMM